jgi:hypothetical protein
VWIREGVFDEIYCDTEYLYCLTFDYLVSQFDPSDEKPLFIQGEGEISMSNSFSNFEIKSSSSSENHEIL